MRAWEVNFTPILLWQPIFCHKIGNVLKCCFDEEMHFATLISFTNCSDCFVTRVMG